MCEYNMIGNDVINHRHDEAPRDSIRRLLVSQLGRPLRCDRRKGSEWSVLSELGQFLSKHTYMREVYGMDPEPLTQVYRFCVNSPRGM